MLWFGNVNLSSLTVRDSILVLAILGRLVFTVLPLLMMIAGVRLDSGALSTGGGC